METDEILEQLNIRQLNCYVKNEDDAYEPAPPTVLSSNLLFIRGLLLQLVDKVADAERDYRKSKATKFDQLIQKPTDGKAMSRSAAMDALDLDPDLIDKKISTERLKNFMKYTDGLCTTIQSVLKVQSSSDKNAY